MIMVYSSAKDWGLLSKRSTTNLPRLINDTYSFGSLVLTVA